MSVDSASVNDPATGRFLNGNPSAYRLRLAAKADIRHALERDYVFAKPFHAMLLNALVDLTYDGSHARKKTDRTRALNTLRRMLSGIPKRKALMDALVP